MASNNQNNPSKNQPVDPEKAKEADKPEVAPADELDAKQKAELDARLADLKAKADAQVEEDELAGHKQALANRLSREAEPPKTSADPAILAGDIKVLCLVDDPSIKMGGRRYDLKKNKVLAMDPSHALHLQNALKVMIKG